MNKKILKIIVLILIYVSISLIVYTILCACGLNSVSKIRDCIDNLGVWGYIVFFLFQVIVSTFVCIIPFEDELLTVSAIVLFGTVNGFFVAAFNMFVTSILQFAIGRYFCKGVIIKLVGAESIDKYQNCLQGRGEIMLPILYAIPLFPHDSLCILAGMSKMRFCYFAPITLIMRSIEIASLCFLGSGIIDFSTFCAQDWIIFINLIIIDIYLILKLHKYVDKKMHKNN